MHTKQKDETNVNKQTINNQFNNDTDRCILEPIMYNSACCLYNVHCNLLIYRDIHFRMGEGEGRVKEIPLNVYPLVDLALRTKIFKVHVHVDNQLHKNRLFHTRTCTCISGEI